MFQAPFRSQAVYICTRDELLKEEGVATHTHLLGAPPPPAPADAADSARPSPSQTGARGRTPGGRRRHQQQHRRAVSAAAGDDDGGGGGGGGGLPPVGDRYGDSEYAGIDSLRDKHRTEVDSWWAGAADVGAPRWRWRVESKDKQAERALGKRGRDGGWLPSRPVYEVEIRALRERVATLEQALATSKHRAAWAEKERRQQVARATQAREAEFRRLRTRLDASLEAWGDASSRADGLHKKLEHVRHIEKECLSEADAAREQSQVMFHKAKRAAAALREQKAANQSLAQEARTVQRRVDSMTDNSIQLRENAQRIRELERALDKAQSETMQASLALKALEQQYKTLSRDHGEAQTSLSALGGDKEVADKEVGALRQRAQLNDTTISRLREKLTASERALEEARSTIRARDREAAERLTLRDDCAARLMQLSPTLDVAVQPVRSSRQAIQITAVNPSRAASIAEGKAGGGSGLAAGLQVGDLITAIEGRDTPTLKTYKAALQAFPRGRTVCVSLLRAGRPVAKSVCIGARGFSADELATVRYMAEYDADAFDRGRAVLAAKRAAEEERQEAAEREAAAADTVDGDVHDDVQLQKDGDAGDSGDDAGGDA